MSGLVSENEAFLTRQLITYIGNKRALLDFIGGGLRRVQKRLNKKKLKLFDVFSGSGIVARYFKQYAELLIANDLEKYAALIGRCYLSNRDERDRYDLRGMYGALTDELGRGLSGGIISELYAPKDERRIKRGERVFYTARNAGYIDTARKIIGSFPEPAQRYFLGPLLSEASVHANTSGVFKGFYKNRETGLGQYGGKNRDALQRITGDIKLPFPVFSSYDVPALVYNGDANAVIADVPEVDAAYLDPPYNQHPYGSNYFMLNIIADNACPENISRVSGIPAGWNRSKYNGEKSACAALKELISGVRAKFVLISFNSEGFISPMEMSGMLKAMGKFEILETSYNAFRGSRNLSGRALHVKEYLYLLEK
jgi:adenine-specific DNA-methyltransferase